ncbi:MAG: prepilin-type N-terminal cleavage/methylation domain-containing protein [Deltaproteobacteria bacterium]|nr:prepilin-type N-terminal cleavage/methylation domain-containing protein [Deltaproteobacteria bacterium]
MRRAFSLIEVMVSGTLLVVGLAAAFSAYGTIAGQLNHAGRRSTAGALAEGMLEELVLRFPADPALTLGTHVDDPRFYDQGGKRVAAGDFKVTWRVAPYAKVKSIREVTVVVAWTDVGGPRTLEVRTWRN